MEHRGHVKFAEKKDIEKHLNTKGGGSLTTILKDLELCGFIEKYQPYQVEKSSNLFRYAISDSYLRFYFKFISPLFSSIQQGDYQSNPLQALNKESYQKWLGFAFERFCHKENRMIAGMIGFSAVRYKSGVFFNRKTSAEDPGYQVDLIFDRADRVLTICEIKYTWAKTGTEEIEAFEKKIDRIPDVHGKTIEKVLITASGASDALINLSYFDRIITLEDIFNF